MPRRRIPLGWPDLDLLVRGPSRGEVFTVIARSGVGKSLVATNVMANNPDERILFFSLEMPDHQVLHRLAAHVFGYPARELEEEENHQRLPSFVDKLEERLPFQIVVDDSALSFDDMSAYVADYETYYGERPRLVIIDYLEEVGGGKVSGEGWTRTEASASAAKTWAKEERIAVLLLHQTNRLTKSWEAPDENSAKGAGYTEADVMIGLWRPGWDPETNPTVKAEREGWIAMNVLKNRVRGLKHDGLLYRIDPAMKIVPSHNWGPRNETILSQVPEYLQR